MGSLQSCLSQRPRGRAGRRGGHRASSDSVLATGSAPRSARPRPQTRQSPQCRAKPTGVPRPGHSGQLPSARQPGPVYTRPLFPSRPGQGVTSRAWRPICPGLSQARPSPVCRLPGVACRRRPGSQPSDQPRGHTALSAPGAASVSHSGRGGGAGRGSCQRPRSDWADAQAQGPDSPALPGRPRCPHVSPY